MKGGDGSFHPTCFFAIPLGLGELGGSPRCMVAWRALELLTPEHSILIHQSDWASHTNRTSKRDLRAFRKSFTIPSGTKRCIEAPCFQPSGLPHESPTLPSCKFCKGWTFTAGVYYPPDFDASKLMPVKAWRMGCVTGCYWRGMAGVGRWLKPNPAGLEAQRAADDEHSHDVSLHHGLRQL